MTPSNERLSTEAVTPSTAPPRRSISGVGRVLVVVYGILALGATGRSFVQIAERFDEAPLAYSLSALAALVYIVATIALIRSGSGWYRIAWATISFELLGVLTIGTLSIVEPQWFPEATVWSYFGAGYLFIPLVLPPLGMWWLSRHRPAHNVSGTAA
jgi:hypothetical protein